MSTTATNGRHRGVIPAEPPPSAITVKIDPREKHQFAIAPMPTVTGTLVTGDYSVVGLEDVISLERKSLNDLLHCVGQDRERFDREIMRLLAFPHRCLVIESDWATLEMGQWPSQVTPASVIGSLLAWMGQGLPVILAGNHERASKYASRWLYIAARRRWREARALVNGTLNQVKEQEHAVVQ